MRVIKALEEVELDNPQLVYKKYPHELSGGMRQRVMIASAMICEPKLLIADEPTTALDVTIQLQIVKLLQRLNQEKKMAVLFISHDLSLVKRLCDRVIVMHNGTPVLTGAVQSVFENAEKLASIGLDVPQLTRIFLRLKAAGVDVRTDIYTLPEAKRELLRLMRERGVRND